MSATIPVSAVLITKNAEQHLDRVLRPLSVCREIVVLDSGSVDRTVRIARAHGARCVDHPFSGYGPQKQRAVALASHDWILSLDADEVLDRDATAALTSIDWSTEGIGTCWRIRRRNFIGLREICHGHWKTDRPVRVFNRRATGFTADLVHESVRPTSRTRDLPGSMLHFSYADLGQIIRLDYHRLKVIRYREAGRTAGGAHLAVRAAWAAFHSYVIRAGFLEGGAGVVIALSAAVNATLGLAMASEPEAAVHPYARPELRPMESSALPRSA